MSDSKKLLFIVTGSIAAYKACDALSRLVQGGYVVRVVATPAALRFVGAATLEGLTGQPVVSDLWESGRALDHIQLTRWADAVVVCPATANTINRLAAGFGDDLVGALFLARDPAKPWLVTPAMNPAMWSHPATEAAVARLRGWAVRFLAVGRGHTACGETGEGRLAEPAEIVFAVDALLARPARKLRVLITSGGTAEAIDGVRILTNTSTGRTGARLAEHFARAGHEVTLLRATQTVPAPVGVTARLFFSFYDLDRALSELLGGNDFDAVIHAAAVSDFHLAGVMTDGVAQPTGAKLDSQRPASIALRPNPKLVADLRARSRNPAVRVVAFKLTRGATASEIQTAVARLFEESPADYVVHNDLTARGTQPDDFPATVHRRDGGAILCPSRAILAECLERSLLSFPQAHTIS
ncbi:MAG: bifunctional phosphopantothenoylcysteine decarboxylase/phosphopantothenate--cysteine ligase CoaBC [Undibacterium sp.]|nr:bifunctional phosphopantothenoylcysteine decarboxylase/phosphopantothenate--cysteine ligase CoaBC [Opitutaceae bacterium]